MTDRPKEHRVMKEIHEIRLKIQEEIKDMTPEERAAYFANAVHEAEKLCGVTFRRPEGYPAHKVS